MTVELEHLYLAFPYRLTPKNLFDGHAFDMAGLNAMQASDHIPQFFNVSTHCAAIGAGNPLLLRVVASLYMPLFLADEPSNLIKLQVTAWQVPHFAIH